MRTPRTRGPPNRYTANGGSEDLLRAGHGGPAGIGLTPPEPDHSSPSAALRTRTRLMLSAPVRCRHQTERTIESARKPADSDGVDALSLDATRCSSEEARRGQPPPKDPPNGKTRVPEGDQAFHWRALDRDPPDGQLREVEPGRARSRPPGGERHERAPNPPEGVPCDGGRTRLPEGRTSGWRMDSPDRKRSVVDVKMGVLRALRSEAPPKRRS